MLAILTTHPIQYQVPLWQALARDGRTPFEVWYLTRHGVAPSLDREFGKTFAWDIETLKGYPYRFLDASAGTAFLDCRLREPLDGRLRASGAKAIWIQGWQVAAYWQAARAAKSVGAKVWLRGESNNLCPRSPWKRSIRGLALRWLFSQVNEFLYIGSANRRLYEDFGVSPQSLRPAPYAVDNERFANQAGALRPRRKEIRRNWGISEESFCVLFCGKFVAKKRPQDLIAAAGKLNHELSKRLHLLFVGSGTLGAQLRASCNVVFDADLPLNAESAGGPVASFTGFLNQTEVSRAYIAADCLVLPSGYDETWGLVVNEALASGLPCLVSEACGCAEDLIGESWRFPVGDVEALAGRLTLLTKSAPNHPGPLPTISETVSSVAASYQASTSKGPLKHPHTAT